MTEQPGSVVDEAVRLLESLRQKVVRAAVNGAVDQVIGKEETDVWAEAVKDRPRWATGSAECCVCPVCRAIAAARASGGDVSSGLTQARDTILGVVKEAVTAYEKAFAAPGTEVQRYAGTSEDRADAG